MRYRVASLFPVGPFPSLALAAVCMIGLLAIAGCGNQGRPPLGQVHGHVTLDGKPLVHATVMFTPEGGTRESTAQTDDNGDYVLKYIRDDLGAAIGKHSVRITKFRSPDPNSDIVPEKYNKKTILTAEVKSGENEIPFDLTSR